MAIRGPDKRYVIDKKLKTLGASVIIRIKIKGINKAPLNGILLSVLRSLKLLYLTFETISIEADINKIDIIINPDNPFTEWMRHCHNETETKVADAGDGNPIK